ncbi:dihydroxy-acid dehydratase, partial [Methylobacterium sp. B1]|uniref:dihydroxy-acid dehydratase domain-containing protein n=1 Tax=Methylobacterium sp. B1 TaxID=91459 RepID=UPI002072D7D0
MVTRLNDKSKLPSRHVTEGPDRAPHRSYLYAMGLTREQIHQPLVGVASCWNEAAPCNISLMRQAQAVKKGVAAANGTPREFCTITVTDGIAMGHGGMRASLPSREVIADSVELTMRGHAYDALVGLAGCDKSLPGMMMAMVRLNVPSIFIYGGSILPGSFRGKPVTVQDLFEAVGKVAVGDMSLEDLDELEQVACPSAGACGAQFTANTMATVSEAIGLALPYSAGAPAPYEIRDKFCATAGEKVMELLANRIRPRDIVTRKALENAATVVAASGGSILEVCCRSRHRTAPDREGDDDDRDRSGYPKSVSASARASHLPCARRSRPAGHPRPDHILKCPSFFSCGQIGRGENAGPAPPSLLASQTRQAIIVGTDALPILATIWIALESGPTENRK